MTVQRVRLTMAMLLLTMAMLLAVASTLLIGSPASADGPLRDHAVERGRLIDTALATDPLADAVTTTSITATGLTPSITTLPDGDTGSCSATVTNTGTSALTSRTVTSTLPAGHAIVGSGNT